MFAAGLLTWMTAPPVRAAEVDLAVTSIELYSQTPGTQRITAPAGSTVTVVIPEALNAWVDLGGAGCSPRNPPIDSVYYCSFHSGTDLTLTYTSEHPFGIAHLDSQQYEVTATLDGVTRAGSVTLRFRADLTLSAVHRFGSLQMGIGTARDSAFGVKVHIDGIHPQSPTPSNCRRSGSRITCPVGTVNPENLREADQAPLPPLTGSKAFSVSLPDCPGTSPLTLSASSDTPETNPSNQTVTIPADQLVHATEACFDLYGNAISPGGGGTGGTESGSGGGAGRGGAPAPSAPASTVDPSISASAPVNEGAGATAPAPTTTAAYANLANKPDGRAWGIMTGGVGAGAAVILVAWWWWRRRSGGSG